MKTPSPNENSQKKKLRKKKMRKKNQFFSTVEGRRPIGKGVNKSVVTCWCLGGLFGFKKKTLKVGIPFLASPPFWPKLCARPRKKV
jgi:hypothetical protein